MSKRGEILKVGEAECRAMLLSCGDASADRCNLFFLQRKVVKLCDNQGLGEPSEEHEELYERVVTHAREKGEIHVMPDAPGKVKVPKEVPDAAEVAAREKKILDKEKAKRKAALEEKMARERAKKALLVTAGTGGAKRGRKAKTVSNPGLSDKVSDLDAAYQVLLAAKVPIHIRELVLRIEEGQLWKPGEGCKTPMIMTLKAHLYQDVKRKGADSRFKLEGKGLFAARKGS